MRSIVAAALALSFALPFVLPAEAQTRLPRASPSERKVREINRNLGQEQRQLRYEQQNQFEINQLRQSIERQRVFSNPSPPARIGGCPAGSVGCN